MIDVEASFDESQRDNLFKKRQIFLGVGTIPGVSASRFEKPQTIVVMESPNGHAG
jgi:hypothetical protein